MSWLKGYFASCFLILVAGCQDARITELRSSDSERRAAACHRLATDPNVPQKVCQVLLECVHDETPEVRKLAIEALANAGAPAGDVLPDMQDAIEDSDPDVSIAAALAALRFDAQLPKAREVVLVAIRAENPHVMRSIGELGAAASWAVPALRELQTNRQPQIRELAKLTIASIQDQSFSNGD